MVALNAPYCQICFDAIPDPSTVVTALCSSKCPAVLCQSCLVHHVSVALEVGYVGALPRVRCPICLVRVNKSQWKQYMTPATMTVDMKWVVLDRYAELCRQACTFRTPCCHNSYYVHLPDAFDAPGVTPQTCVLLKSQVQALRKKCRQFGRHKIGPRDLITYISDAVPAEKHGEVFKGVLERLMDEERRATLMLSYHALHRVVVTSCCAWRVCFNCKRASPDEATGCECEREDDEIDEETALVQCRSCRAMLVKVDGCDSVYCMCGFAMDWIDELRYRDEHKKKLLPVDPFDTTIFDEWVGWHGRLTSMLDVLRNTAQVQMRLKFISKTHPSFLPALRQFVWWHRFRRLHRSELLATTVRTKYMNRVLVPLLQPALIKRVVQRRMQKQVLAELGLVVRQKFVIGELTKQRRVLAPFLSAVMAKSRTKRVMQQLQSKFFWKVYAENHEAEQQQIESEESAFLTMFNV